MDVQPLTDRQREVLEVVERSIAERGYPPTQREICVELGLSGRLGVQQHLHAIERKGWIRLAPGVSRGITVLPRSAS